MEGGENGKIVDLIPESPEVGTKWFTTKEMIDVSKNIVVRAQNPVKLTFKNIN